jgi:hypothetical protein
MYCPMHKKIFYFTDSHFFYPDPTEKKQTIIGIVVNGGINAHISRSHKNAIHVQNSKSIDIKKIYIVKVSV